MYTCLLHHVSTTVTPYWQVHQRSRLTSFKECSTLLLASLPVPTSSTDRGLSRLLHSELHWLDIPERVTYKLGVIMFGYQHGRAPQYLIDYCLPVSDVASRQHLRSASRRLLVVPSTARTAAGRLLSVAGATAWNSFPDNLRDPDLTTDNFKHLLKTFFFSAYQCN